MNQPRSWKVYYTRLGRRTAIRGRQVGVALTGTLAYDRWIQEGYHSVIARNERHKKTQFNLYREKAGGLWPK
jgi:hypothetical protein